MTQRSGCLKISTLSELLPDAVADRAGAMLGEAERQRLASMSSTLRRRQFLAGHYLARQLAASQWGGEPDQWAWQVAEKGRPFLTRQGKTCHLSLSHCGERLACVVAEEPVGLDLQFPDRERDWKTIARGLFSEVEQQRLTDISAERLASECLTLWTLKEAHGKFIGKGLQRAIARRFTAYPSAVDDADAVTVALEQGSLAVVFSPGFMIDSLRLAAFPSLRYWRLRNDA